MNRRRTYHLMNPLTGIWPAYGDAPGYRYASPNGDEGRNNQHFGAHHVSAVSTPRCDSATTILHSPFLILNWSHTFSAKERDSETGLSYFGARYYSSDLSIWLSVDPMSGKYPSLSPYVYCADNPVKLVDSNGEEINPIYDLDGNFLGTDDNGLQGKALFLKRSDFKQNMSPETARQLDQGESSLKNEAAKEKFKEHYQGLKNRPDYDGYITLNEANEWYRNGKGEPLFADLRKIDLTGFRSLGESKVGENYNYNLIYTSGSKDDRLVYGSLTFIRTPNDGVRAYADGYDFDMKPWRGNTVRNIQTLIGRRVAGEGKSYSIFLYGTATLKSSLFAH